MDYDGRMMLLMYRKIMGGLDIFGVRYGVKTSYQAIPAVSGSASRVSSQTALL